MAKDKVDSEKTAKKPQKVQAGPKPQAKAFEGIKIIRIAETDLQGDDNIFYGLTKIRGISWAYSNAVLKATKVPDKTAGDLTDEEIEKIKDAIANPVKYGIPLYILNRQKDLRTGKNYHLLSSDLVFANKMDVEALKQVRCFRGVRHMYNYKVRGQRTRSRGANVRGRVGGTVGVVKKKQAPAKAQNAK